MPISWSNHTLARAHLYSLLCSKVSNDALEGLMPHSGIVSVVECKGGLVSVLDDVATVVELERPLHEWTQRSQQCTDLPHLHLLSALLNCSRAARYEADKRGRAGSPALSHRIALSPGQLQSCFCLHAGCCTCASSRRQSGICG